MSEKISVRRSLQVLHTCTLVTHEGGQVMYVAMLYFVFMEAMVS